MVEHSAVIAEFLHSLTTMLTTRHTIRIGFTSISHKHIYIIFRRTYHTELSLRVIVHKKT